MFKYTIVILALIACAAAKPGLIAPLSYSAPIIAGPGIVTARSSQVIARNYNGIATAPVFAAAPLAAKYVASPLAYSAPFTAAPLAYSAPFGYASAYGYASPLSYAASAQLLL